MSSSDIEKRSLDDWYRKLLDECRKPPLRRLVQESSAMLLQNTLGRMSQDPLRSGGRSKRAAFETCLGRRADIVEFFVMGSIAGGGDGEPQGWTNLGRRLVR
jgi:hypothetical protein